MKAGVLKLAIIVAVINLVFLYIGIDYLPQSESLPPKTIVLKPGISQADLVAIGEKIVFGKGQCMVCHGETPSKTERAPAMATMGSEIVREAKERGITPEQHVFEALVNPGGYIVKGFENIMPAANESPTSLTDGEIIAVAAYLQSQGSTVTVSYPGSVPVLKAVEAKAAKGGSK
jgi:mono/diheme cytochrome c family protein